MAESRFLLKPSDADYGLVCPECAAPKHRQSRRCKDCYYDARRRGEYPPPPMPERKPPVLHAEGRSKGRPQPSDHPWRKQNELFFVQRRVREMVDAGVRPATPGGRIRAHFASLDEVA